ncbi:WGxxGxxG-CTERM domain-containing protein [Paenibacillus sp. S-38]|uniref:WGxxGxxG-CTERM domain-containing protein n=1 Tax=Paenibacillus sp. S-38 TaxID=3416710 RepID=UPI003CF004C2
MIKTVGLGLLLALNPAAGQSPPQETGVVDYYGTNPTLWDTSFAKTVAPHANVPQFRVQGTDGELGQADLTDGRWGDPGGTPYRAAGTAPGKRDSHWLGLAGLLGLLGLRRRAEVSSERSRED